MKYWIKDIIFLPFIPLMYLTDFLARIGVGVFSKGEPEFNLKNMLSLLGFIVISPLIILISPIQRAYINHVQEKMRNNKQSEQTDASNPAPQDTWTLEGDEMDAYEKRIHAILGDDNERTKQNASRYLSHLLKNLSLPVIVTGTEDFPWEEPYVMGGWSQREYEKLKKTNPSYTDTFELQALGHPNEHEDIIAKVKRLSDGRVFEIGLSWLCCKDNKSHAYTLLADYGVWHTNY